jgi:hypothetical protein
MGNDFGIPVGVQYKAHLGELGRRSEGDEDFVESHLTCSQAHPVADGENDVTIVTTSYVEDGWRHEIERRTIRLKIEASDVAQVIRGIVSSHLASPGAVIDPDCLSRLISTILDGLPVTAEDAGNIRQAEAEADSVVAAVVEAASHWKRKRLNASSWQSGEAEAITVKN